MKTLPYRQGTPEWLAERSLPNTYTASEAPAMLGLSKYKTRTELIREKATGITPEVDTFTQGLFDAGHEAEASTRAWAEAEVGDDLYPVTGTIEIEGLRLLASFDGLTMDESIAWENKKWNQEFAAQVLAGEVPDTHWPQLEQQLLVSGAEKVLFTISDGGETAIAHLWYTSQPERRARLIAGWKQFAEDVANYQHVEVIPAAVATPQIGLPAVSIRVDGSIALVDNLSVFGNALTAYIERINKRPETDQDFADLEATVKTLKRAEDELDAAENSALGQAASIDAMRKTVALYRNMARDNRLLIDKMVKAEKENRKSELVIQARDAMLAHLNAIEDRLGGAWMPRAEAFPPVGDVVKGLKTLDSMRDRLSVWLANAKVQANEVSDRIERNHKSVEDWTLVPDFGAICQKAHDDFTALIGMRKQQRAEAEAKRLEAERARIIAEERAKAEHQARVFAEVERERIRTEEQAKARAEQAERDAEAARVREAERAQLEQERQKLQEEADAARLKREEDDKRQAAEHAGSESISPSSTNPLLRGDPPRFNATMVIPIVEQNQPVDNGATMKLGEIGARLGFAVTADFLAQLGFKPHAIDKNAKLYREFDFARICNALIDHINAAMRDVRKAA